MRGRKQDTELEQLEAGLGAAEDPYMIKELIARPTEDLAAEVRKEIRYSALSMLRAGRIFMAIKSQLKHGGWEPFVAQQRWSWQYVRCCMKLVEVASKFPQAVHLPSGRVVQQLLHLPAPRVEEIFTELPAEAIEKLTPWDLEKIYNKKKLEKPKKEKPKTDREVEVEDVDALVIEVEGLLRQIAELDLKKSSQKKLDGYRASIEVAWNRAAYNMRDPKHESKPPWELDPMHDDISEE